MCGIIGYIGPKDVVPVLIDGLRRLEYRGYDSAGVAVVRNGTVNLRRSAGKLSNLEEVIDADPIAGDFESAPVDDRIKTFSVAFAELWDGRRWSLQPTPHARGSSHLNGASCASPDFCIAAGSLNNQTIAFAQSSGRMGRLVSVR